MKTTVITCDLCGKPLYDKVHSTLGMDACDLEHLCEVCCKDFQTKFDVFRASVLVLKSRMALRIASKGSGKGEY
jgi:hypothetical protein